ncbi:MAG: YihA family ribosome biogenesis GTP-binding protein [Ruminococcaceae bacterium]|nr:YihA family ribosome biogenesis GTP-binding protein [Oscillospiraceae bacterium]
MALNLNAVSLRISAGLPKQFPTDPMVQIAFSGRSNVGKSSLINSLLGRKSLARVSASPGKTITINFYDVDKKLFLVDLPGYGFAKRPPADKEQWSALTDGYFTKNPNLDLLKLVIQLVDSRIGPTADDEMMLAFLREAQIPFLVVATKADKLNATERKKSEALLRNHPDIPADTPIIFYSALKAEGKTELWNQIHRFTGLN